MSMQSGYPRIWSFDTKALVFGSFTDFKLSSTDYIRDTNQYSQVPNCLAYDNFFTEPDTKGKVITIGSILQIERDVANWRMTSVEFREVATGWYMMKFFKGEDGRRWLLLNVRSKIGYKLGLFEQREICTKKESDFHLRERVRNALKEEWEWLLKKTGVGGGAEPVIVDVAAVLDRLMGKELKNYEEQEGVEASATQTKEHRQRVWEAFRREIRDSDALKMVSWTWNPETKKCKIRVALTSLVIHACMVATDRKECHNPKNMKTIARTVADFERLRRHIEMSEWSRMLKRTLPDGEKGRYMDVDIDKHGMRSNVAKLRMFPELCLPAGEAPALQTLRDLIASSPNVHTTQDAFAVVEQQFELSCQAFGVERLILPGMRSPPSQ
jgi:hypothetical protein